MASSSISPCAACKFLRRKCQPDCVFAPYFPPDHPQKFANVHKVFGASNVTKLLNDLHPHQREDAVNTLAYEAEMRLRDPVYGCVGVISLLQHQLRQLQMDLTSAKSELSKYQNHHHQYHMINGAATHGLIAPAADATRLHHHDGVGSIMYHQQAEFFPPQDQNGATTIRGFDVKYNYDDATGGVGPHVQYQQHMAAGSGGDQRTLPIDPS